jgi:SAM-dependent methyltransferase
LKDIKYQEKIEFWENEEKASFLGWDFSHIDNRWEYEKNPFDYKKIVLSYLKPDYKLLDMGTGGGEFLLTLKHPYSNTYVTEGFLPNYNFCKTKLAPLGITVKYINEDDKIDYSDNFFDIIINRHESYDINEIYRVLKPGGIFITQQIGNLNDLDLSKKINPNFKSLFNNNNLKYIKSKLESNNFSVLKTDEKFTPIKFFDTGAFVYFAKIIEWEFPNFSVKNNLTQLIEIDEEINNNGYLQAKEHRFIIVARKNKI